MILSTKQKLKARARFILSFIRFKYFLRKQKLQSGNDGTSEATYIIIVSPWLMTAAPWFALATGLLLHCKKYKIQVLVDDLPFESPTDHILQVKLIKVALTSFRKLNIKIDFLSQYKSTIELSQDELNFVNKLAVANAIHKNRGEEDTTHFRSLCNKNFSLLINNFPFVKSFVMKNDSQTYFFSGGIYANSGLFEILAKVKDRSYFTFDSGFEVLLSTYKGVAAQFTDIPTSLNLLLSAGTNEINFAREYAKVEFEKRKNGTNKLNSQYQSFEDSETFEDVGILIPLNSPWDSAALNISSLFTSYNEWLLESIDIILANSNYNITIRQHPDERFWWGRTKTDFNELIKARFKDKRIQFVTCFDKVNTYALLQKCKAVVCYSSTFGIEASMAGKSVCVCSNVYYSKLGFAFRPSNVEDFKFFLKNIDGDLGLEQEKAFLTYYLGQQCNWLFTPFTPTTVDLKKWLSMGIDGLLNDRVIGVYLSSLEHLTPMSYLNHKKNYLEQAKNFNSQADQSVLS